jgi:transposase
MDSRLLKRRQKRQNEDFIQQQEERIMKDLTVIGIDIAKNFMQLHGATPQGKVVFKKRLPRSKFLPFMANVPKCLIGMEACGGANYWAKELIKLGFTMKLMSPRKVKKFVENQKNDANDAQACAEAAVRASVPAIPIKTEYQSGIQALHRARSYQVKQHTGLMNMIRGLLLEHGLAVPKKKSALIKQIQILLDPEDNSLFSSMKELLLELYEGLKRLGNEIARFTQSLEKLGQEDELCKRLKTLTGVGPITATAIVAKIGNGSEFHKGRELSAYLGLVPKQNSSGEKQRLGGISKHGDRYIRQLLVHGGRACVQAALRKNKITGLYDKQDVHSEWIRKLAERVGMNKASVAVANKNARIVLAMLKNKTTFDASLAH